jgi:hypothetical protein
MDFAAFYRSDTENGGGLIPPRGMVYICLYSVISCLAHVQTGR